MKKLVHRVNNELGLHARPAGRLASIAAGFSCDVKISAASRTVDAKGVIGVMGLALTRGDELSVTFDGADEAEAMAAIETFLRENL